jgi:hypothetical protein
MIQFHLRMRAAINSRMAPNPVVFPRGTALLVFIITNKWIFLYIFLTRERGKLNLNNYKKSHVIILTAPKG